MSSDALTQRLLEQLESTGKKREVEAELVRKLKESGWHDQLKGRCMEIIQQKGPGNVTVDELVHLVAPEGRASVPNTLKQEMLVSMREFVKQLGDL